METNFINELKFFGASLNILIVEDDKELRESLLDLLKTFFKKVDIAKDGLEALNKYKSNKYDLVLTDINMPLMNGIELSKEIRMLKYDQCILVLSAYIDDFVIDLIDIGIQGLILKPFETNKFIMTLCRNSENILMKREFRRRELKLKNTTQSINPEKIKSGIEKLVEKKIDFDKTQRVSVSKSISLNQTLISWEIIEDDIKDYNCEMSEIIDYIMLNGINDENLESLSRVFSKYHSSFTLLDDMEHFSLIFEELYEFFGSLRIEDIPSDKLKDFDAYLYIYDDLLNFFDLVFIKKECSNINYLTDSLISSIAQMKYALTTDKLDEEELELF